MKKVLFGNILVLNFVRKIQLNLMSTSQNINQTKQVLKIDIVSDNICRE